MNETYWMSVLPELHSRGAENRMIVCCDRLASQPEAIGADLAQHLG